MKLTNQTIENYYKLINNPNFFVKKCSFPKEVRAFFKKNLQLILEGYQTFFKETQELINSFIEQGKAIQDDNKIQILDEHQQEWMTKFNELYKEEQELDFVTIDKELADEILNLNMTLVEEDFINSFIKQD